MNKIKIKKIGDVIYHEVLPNGLNVFILKKEGFNKKGAYFMTKYGSIYNEFVPLGYDKMQKLPLGIAHFLEHKMFENEDGSNAFEFFEGNGAYVNAFTAFDNTTYLFNSTDNFNECLTYLIDMVQSVYLTNENVEKEKGIICQEMDMCNNDASQAVFDRLFNIVIKENQIKYDIIGTKEDVNRTTKEDLIKCYNTFYHPSNMCLVIAGDVDVNEVMDLVKNNQANKKFPEPQKIITKECEEPSDVGKKTLVLEHNVKYPKIGYCYKNILNKLTPEEDIKIREYANIFIKSLFGTISGVPDELIKQGLVNSYFDAEEYVFENILLLFFNGDVLDDDKVRHIIEDKLKNERDLKESFELYKKGLISEYVSSFDMPLGFVGQIKFMYRNYNTIIDNLYDIYKNMTYEEYITFINSLNFDNMSKVIINPINGGKKDA